MNLFLAIGIAFIFCFNGVDLQLDKMNIVHRLDIKIEVGTAMPCLALSPDGATAFFANGKGSTIFEYDTISGKLRHEINTGLKYIQCVQVSPDGTMLAVGSDGLILFSLQNRNELFHRDESSRVNSIAFSPDSKFLAYGTVAKVAKVLNLPNGKGWQSFAGSKGPVMCMSFSPDGNDCASGGLEQAIRVWNAKNGSEKEKISTPLSVTAALAYSGDGHYLCFSSTGQNEPSLDPLKLGTPNELKIWDIRQSKVSTTIVDKMARINALFISKDAKHVIAVSENNVAYIWQGDPEKRDGYSAIWSTTRCKVLAVSRDFQKMATVGLDGSLAIWELKRQGTKNDFGSGNTAGCNPCANGGFGGFGAIWQWKRGHCQSYHYAALTFYLLHQRSMFEVADGKMRERFEKERITVHPAFF